MAEDARSSNISTNVENFLQTETSGEEPCKKKLKYMDCSTPRDDGKLEDRLCGILCCVVCLDLPRMTVFQVFKIF